jgi:hypothetical protein
MKHGKGKGTQLLGNKHKHNTNVKEYMQEELSPSTFTVGVMAGKVAKEEVLFPSHRCFGRMSY